MSKGVASRTSRERGPRRGVSRFTSSERGGRVLGELVLGLALVVGGAVAMSAWFQRATTPTDVVVLGRDLQRGHIVTSQDLDTAVVRGAEGLRVMKADDPSLPEILGRRLMVDAAAGTPVDPGLLAPVEPLGIDEALVALAVRDGDFPTRLSASDRVEVVTLSLGSGLGIDDEISTIRAEVMDVTPRGELDAETVVTLRAPRDLTSRLVVADRVRLAVVAS